jgi:hypothetical protein
MSGNDWEVSFSSMNGWTRRTIRFQPGDRIRFRYQAHADTGSLTAELLAPDGSMAIVWGAASPEMTDFTATVPGKYSVRVSAEHAVGGFRVEILPGEPQTV